MKLAPPEQSWLDMYRQALSQRHPGAVTRMVIYGSKARGEAHAESGLDLLLIVKDEVGHLKRQLRRIGYDLAAASDVFPSILAYTEEEWESRRRSGSSFRKAVERNAVAIL